MSDRVCAIVVTHGRADAVRRCLSSLARQTWPGLEVLVVAGAGSHPAAGMATEEFPDVELLRLPDHGGNGYREGLRVAHGRGFEWLWLLHEDAVADDRALEELLAAVARADEGAPPVLMASKIVRPDGKLDLHSLGRPLGEEVPHVVASFERGLQPLRWSSFVSVLVSGRALSSHGLPVASFADGLDELEFTARLLRWGEGYLAPRSVVEHAGRPRIKDFREAPSELPAHAHDRMLVLRTSAWNPGEKIRLAFGLLWAISRAVRSPGHGLAVARAAIKGAFSPIG